MATPEIKATYQQLGDAVTLLEELANRTDKIFNDISGKRDLLRGEWMGFGYNSFAGEMDGEIIPGLKKLASALRTASATVSKISAEFDTTEMDGKQMVQAISAPSLL